MLISKSAFEKLTQDQQTLLLEVCRSGMKELIRRSRKENKTAYEVILKEGVKVVPSTHNQRETMRKIGEKVHERLMGKMYSKELLDDIKTLLEDYRNNSGSLDSPAKDSPADSPAE